MKAVHHMRANDELSKYRFHGFVLEVMESFLIIFGGKIFAKIFQFPYFLKSFWGITQKLMQIAKRHVHKSCLKFNFLQNEPKISALASI